MTFNPTPEQVAIVDHVRTQKTHLQIEALAGAAKTSTLVLAAQHVSADGKPLATAFNHKIKKELEKRLPKHFRVATMNGLGHMAWGKMTGRQLTLDARKASKLISAALAEVGMDHDKDLWLDCRELFEAARTYGLVPTKAPGLPKRFVPDEPETWEAWALDRDIKLTERHIELVRKALLQSIVAGFQGQIDYNDQIYLASCYHGSFTRHDTVFVDEAQDLSALNHYMLRKIVAKRAISVGDRCQAIYAFRGALHDSMDQLAATFAPVDKLSLTTTFRCSKAVVEHVRSHVPNIKAAAWAPDGEVVNLSKLSTLDIKPGSLIACRNNAPLIKLGLRLLADGRPATFLKGEIRNTVEKLIRKVAPDPATPIDAILAGLDLMLLNNPNSEMLVERVECTHVLAEGSRDAGDLLGKLAAIFSIEDAPITLGTGHGCKGLEFDNVYHLDPWRCPSKFATTPEQLQQESNLWYVIATRAKENLYYISLDRIY